MAGDVLSFLGFVIVMLNDIVPFMDQETDKFTKFERIVDGAQYGIAVHLKLTFIVASEGLAYDDMINFEDGVIVDHDNSAVRIDVEGDIMPQGFKHKHGLLFPEEKNDPVLLEVVKKILALEVQVMQMYFNKVASVDKTIGPIKRLFKFVGEEEGLGSTETDYIGFIMVGQRNNHPHWMGVAPS